VGGGCIIFRRIRTIAKSGFQFRHVCPSVRTEQLGPHWTHIHEILCLYIFRKLIEKIQFSLKSDESDGYFTWRTICIFSHISLQFLLEWEVLQSKVFEKIETHLFVFNSFFFILQNRARCEIKWKNIVETDKPWITQYGICAFHTGYLRLQTHTLMICSKGKAVPLQTWSGPEGSRKLRFPDLMTTAQDSGKVVSPTHRPPLPPGNAPGTHFC